jgi:MICOS complex subunit MIC12
VPLPSPPSYAEINRQSRSIFAEIAKDRWNKEIEKAARWVQTTDWTSVRGGMEGAMARFLGLGMEKSQLGIEVAEQRSRPEIQEPVGASKAVAQRVAAADVGRASMKDGPRHTSISSHEATSEAKDSVDRSLERIHLTADKVSSEAYDASAATVSAAQGAVHNVIDKGLEKANEFINGTQAAIELLGEKLESRAEAKMLGMSGIEKALHERYEKKDIPDKTVEEVLEERYKPIDQRDRNSLKGL